MGSLMPEIAFFGHSCLKLSGKIFLHKPSHLFFSSFRCSFLSLPSFLPLLPSLPLFLSQEPVLVEDGIFLKKKKNRSTSNMFYKEGLSHTRSGRILWYLLITLLQPGIHTRKWHPGMWSFVKSKLLLFCILSANHWFFCSGSHSSSSGP